MPAGKHGFQRNEWRASFLRGQRIRRGRTWILVFNPEGNPWPSLNWENELATRLTLSAIVCTCLFRRGTTPRLRFACRCRRLKVEGMKEEDWTARHSTYSRYQVSFVLFRGVIRVLKTKKRPYCQDSWLNENYFVLISRNFGEEESTRKNDNLAKYVWGFDFYFSRGLNTVRFFRSFSIRWYFSNETSFLEKRSEFEQNVKEFSLVRQVSRFNFMLNVFLKHLKLVSFGKLLTRLKQNFVFFDLRNE